MKRLRVKLHSRPGVLTARLRNAKDHQTGEVRMNDWRGERSVCGGGGALASIWAGLCGTSAALTERPEGGTCRSLLRAAISQMTSAADI